MMRLSDDALHNYYEVVTFRCLSGDWRWWQKHDDSAFAFGMRYQIPLDTLAVCLASVTSL